MSTLFQLQHTSSIDKLAGLISTGDAILFLGDALFVLQQGSHETLLMDAYECYYRSADATTRDLADMDKGQPLSDEEWVELAVTYQKVMTL